MSKVRSDLAAVLGEVKDAMREAGESAHLESFDQGMVVDRDDDGDDITVQAYRVMLWASEEDSENDDGAKAIASWMVTDDIDTALMTDYT